MSLYIIARLSSKGKEIGYRIYDTTTKRYVDWQTSRVVNSLKFNAINLINAELGENDTIKGTAGDLKKYPDVDFDSDTVQGQNSYTIVGKDTEEGLLHTVDAYGIPREMHEEVLIKSLKNRGLTNATLVKKSDKPYIRGKKTFEEVGLKYNYIQKDFKTPNHRGLVQKWRVRIIKTGEPYGRQGSIINDSKPLVEFISLDTNQFVARYYVETMLEHDDGYGLNLYGDVDAWSIGTEDLNKIIKWLKSLKL